MNRRLVYMLRRWLKDLPTPWRISLSVALALLAAFLIYAGMTTNSFTAAGLGATFLLGLLFLRRR